MKSLFPFDSNVVSQIRAELGIKKVSQASIRQVVQLVDKLQNHFKVQFIRTEMGVPGFASPQIGVEAEIEALRSGVSSVYPPIQGIEIFKNELSRFARLFMNISIKPSGCIPTAGAMQASAVTFLVANRRDRQKDTTLLIDPGFPVQKRQLGVFGMKYESFDIYDYRGEKLREKLESYLEKGNISSFLYSNPNNPSWICFTEKELAIIGELANKYDGVVVEDLAYFGMDFRRDYGIAGAEPYQASVANYTDNYVLLFSSSKIFSYAGQRLGAVMISDKLFARSFDDLSSHFVSGQFGPALLQEAIYVTSAGISHSAQVAVAAKLKAVNDSSFDFVGYLKEYGERAAIMKQHFLDAGFYLVYDKDEEENLADGFYFTVAFPGLDGEELLSELIRYGISAITLDTTGSSRTDGLRICVSHTTLGRMDELASRLQLFAVEHK